MMIEIDTKESSGGTDLFKRYMPGYKLYRYTDRINLINVKRKSMFNYF